MSTPAIKIGIINPSVYFNNTAVKAARNMGADIELEVALAGMYEAIPIGRQMESEGVEVIVSRRGTARKLRQNLKIPVLSVPLTSFQIFQAVQTATEMGRKILLPIYQEHVDGIDEIEKIFNVEILCLDRYDSNYDEFDKLIQRGIDFGCEVIIGGNRTQTMGRKHGLKAVDLPVCPEMLVATLENARSVVGAQRQEQARTKHYRAIIDSVSEGIIAVDPEGRITTINHVAQDLLRLQDEIFYGRSIDSLLPQTDILQAMKKQRPMLYRMQVIRDINCMLNHVPVMLGKTVIGGIITIQLTSNVQMAENEVRRSLTQRLTARYSIDDFICKSPAACNVVKMVRKYAVHGATVLIIGATGTGKEIIAHSIHNLSRRARGPFVSINCGAISGDLLESELFGYEEGAFTGSRRGGKAGLFELAHNGTIFLDEIGDAPKRVQTRLLRVIQEKEIMRIGGDCLIPVNVRIIAATNKDLNNEVASGRFREDLFFRLNILHLFIPPLRDRIEDLPLLISRLICRKARKNQLLPVTVPQRCLDQLARLDWPGNVRQLSNFLDRLIILCEGTFSDKIFNELFTELVEYSLAQPDAAAKPPAGLKNMMKEKSRGEEARIILTAFEACGFNKDLTAKHLGISRTTLWRKLKALDSE